ERDGGAVSGIVVHATTPDGDGAPTEVHIEAPWVVVAAGAFSAHIGALAGLEIPVVPLRQHLFRLALERPLAYRLPLTFDPTGLYLCHADPTPDDDRECLIFGRSKMDEPPGENFEVDRETFDTDLLP